MLGGPLHVDEAARVAVGPHEVDEGGGRNMVILQEGVSLQDLVAGLNALGVPPRDLIGILQAIEAAGALQADIVVM